MNHKDKRVLLIHGWGGKKELHWLSWLEKKLLERNYKVTFPKIPNNYNPNCEKWVNFMNAQLPTIRPDIVVAHSLGVLTWWHLYHKHDYKVQQIIAVSPPTFASFPSKMSSFFPLPQISFPEDIQTIIYAKDDPNIERKSIQDLAHSMSSQLIEKSSGEHLDHFAKIYELQELLEIIA